jgi:hypothetical protein
LVHETSPAQAQAAESAATDGEFDELSEARRAKGFNG